MEGSICSPTDSSRIAVVSGGNKGIGLEICRQLASSGVRVILTARDKALGMEALEKLKESGLSNVIFHQLDVTDASSIDSLADFIKIEFGKLDILVNNAGVVGLTLDFSALKAAKAVDHESERDTGDMRGRLLPHVVQTYEMAEQCLRTNYNGTKAVTAALLPLLQSSVEGRIINVSSTLGQLRVPFCSTLVSIISKSFSASSLCLALQVISNEELQRELSDVDSLTEERLDELMQLFLKHFKDDELKSHGWPTMASAYRISKVLINAYTRVLTKNHRSLYVNCVHPGFTKTDLNYNTGILGVEEGARGPVLLALGGHGKSTGLFFDRDKVSDF